MRYYELIVEEIEDKGQIQGELMSAMVDSGEFAQIKWQDTEQTQGYQMMISPQVDPAFKNKMNQIFTKYLGVSMEHTVTASTATNEKANIFKVINFLQRNVNNKSGINPKAFGLKIANYRIDQASVFNWRGANFLIIKDTSGNPQQLNVVGPARQINYSIFAAKD